MAEVARPDWEQIPAIQDKEVSEPEGDRFGHRDLELALRGLLESDGYEPPYSVGLLGRWGSGKSTVRAMYESRLAEDTARSRKVRTIPFDAWRFGKDEVKRALLRHLYLELGGDDSELRDELYRQVQRHSTENRPFSEVVADLWALWKAVAVQFLLLLVAVLVLAAVVLYLLGIDTALAQALVVSAAFGSLPFLARYLLNPVPWRANVTRLDLPRTTAEQYEDFLKVRLSAYGREKPNVERVVVFVDDLDRLPAEEMVDGLDAVRGFMDIPGGTEGGVGGTPGIVFVISCDEGKVAEALADRRRRNDSELPATITGKEDARHYLDRIFQFRLEVPPPPKRDMRVYAKRRLREDLALVADDLEERGISLDDVVDRMIHPGVQSPRTAVHMLNAFARSWWLAHRREQGGGATRAGGLVEGAVTGHPQTLAALAALQVDFPEFYDDLEENPGLLDAFSDVFVDGVPLSDQPTGLHDLLEGYRLGGRDDGAENLVKPRHRPLRSFVSGLRGLRRPRNLRPLIELAQDQLSRNLGPREEEARAAFVDADTRGVLESLGRANDDGPLTAEQVARLKDVVEDTEGETPTRRDNGGVVLAEIADRLPPERARGLLDPLAFRLRQSGDLRSRVGVARIASLIPRLRRDDQVDLAGALTADVLRPDGEVALETPNLQTPSLEQAIAMAKDAAGAVLGVRERFGLSPSSDEALLDWLEVRRVATGGEAHELPFSDLERWVGEHEEDLLPDLGSRYTAMVAGEIEDGRAITGSGETARRSRRVFALMAAGGRPDHDVLWDHLTAYVSADDPVIARAGWEFAASDTSKADPERFSAFVDALVDRASRAGEYHEQGDAVAPGAGEALARIYRSRPSEVGDGTQEKISELAGFWGREYYEENGRELGAYAVGLAEVLASAGSSHFSSLLEGWSERLLGDLGPFCRRWMASFLPKFNQSGRGIVLGGLAEVTENNAVDDDAAGKYTEFVSALGEDGKSTEEVSEHLGAVARKASALVIDRSQAASYADFSPVVAQVQDYASKVVPALVPLLPYAPADEAATLLNDLFSDGLYIDHARPLFADLHAAMVGRWPASENVPYGPEAVFDRAEEVILAEPALARAPALLHSMASVIEANDLGTDQRRRVLDAACALWPHRQEFVLETISSNEEPPSAGAIASLATGTDPDNSQESSRLRNVWEHCASLLPVGGLAEVTATLVGRAPDEEAGDPDWALGLWLSSVPEPAPTLEVFFEDPDAADEDLERLWERALRNADRLGPQFFRTALLQLFGHQDIERTLSSVKAAKDRVTDFFDRPSAKNELGRGLLEALVASSRNSDKAFLAQWIKDAGAAGSMGHLNSLAPTEEDLGILEEVFADKKLFQKYRSGRNTRRHEEGSDPE